MSEQPVSVSTDGLESWNDAVRRAERGEREFWTAETAAYCSDDLRGRPLAEIDELDWRGPTPGVATGT